jgi:hypothetical protein
MWTFVVFSIYNAPAGRRIRICMLLLHYKYFCSWDIFGFIGLIFFFKAIYVPQYFDEFWGPTSDQLHFAFCLLLSHGLKYDSLYQKYLSIDCLV